MTIGASRLTDRERQRFLDRRRRVVARVGATLLTVAALGGLLLAPNRLAAIRLGGLSLAWWATGVVGSVALVTLALGLGGSRRGGRPAGTSWVASLGLVAVWGSPALWLGLPPLILADGTGGLWPAAAVAAGVVAAAFVRGEASDRDGGPSVAWLARRRWPGQGAPVAVLAIAEASVAALFAGAQLAAMREIAAALGWSREAVLAVPLAVVAAGFLTGRQCRRIAALAGGAALAGLTVPLVVAAITAGATSGSAWSAVASRPRLVFSENSPWTAEGGPVRGPGSRLTLRFSEGQQVTFGSPGPIVLESWLGGSVTREAQAGERLTVYPGDRLTVDAGTRLRFQAGRRIPDAPASGPDWADGLAPAHRWGTVVGLGVTLLLGMLALAPAGDGVGGPPAGARLAASLLLLGLACVVLAALHAAWLAPEIYAGGVSGIEAFEVLAPPSGAGGGALRGLALAGLAAGGVGALVAGLRGIGAAPAARDRRSLPWVRAGVVALGAALALVLSASAWTLLLAALGLAAATLGPTALAVSWSERATARGVALGAAVGLASFAALTLLALAGGAGDAAVLGGLAAWPAALAAPAHGLVVWLLGARRVPGAGAPPPPGLDAAPGDDPVAAARSIP